jgi:hypothetical protein
MIAWLRSIAAVLVGYVVFAVGSFAVFRLSHHPPHAPASASFMLGAIAAGIGFALAGGYVAAWLAGRRPVGHAVAMAGVLAIGAAASLAATLGHGVVWSQTAALTLMAPAAALGGWLRARAV